MSAASLRLVGAEQTGADEIAAYIAWARDLRGLRPNTTRIRGDVLTRLVHWLGRPLTSATADDLLRWEQHAVAGRAPETRRAYVSHVRAFYRWAVASRILEEDPSVRLTSPRLQRALPRPMTEEDLRRAVALARPKMRAMILLCAFCGLRCCEVGGLSWTDLRTEADQTTILVRGKGGGERVVPVPDVVLTALVAYGRRRSGPMFYGLDGAQQRARSVSHNINRHLARIGVQGTAHQLRHRYGTTAYRLTKDIRLVQEMLGHSSPQTTARYAAYDRTGETAMVKAMDEAWEAGDQ